VSFVQWIVIQNGLKEGNAKLTLLFNSAAEYRIMKVQESREEQKLNRTDLLPAYADNANLLR
jgi:hypothetical protein